MIMMKGIDNIDMDLLQDVCLFSGLNEAPHSRAVGYLMSQATEGCIDHSLSQPQQSCGV